jgi:hypothetical protein
VAGRVWSDALTGFQKTAEATPHDPEPREENP